VALVGGTVLDVLGPEILGEHLAEALSGPARRFGAAELADLITRIERL